MDWFLCSVKSFTDSSPPSPPVITETTDDDNDNNSSGTEPEPESSSIPVQNGAFAVSWLADMATGGSDRIPHPPVATRLAASVFLLLVTGEIFG